MGDEPGVDSFTRKIAAVPETEVTNQKDQNLFSLFLCSCGVWAQLVHRQVVAHKPTRVDECLAVLAGKSFQ